MTLRIGTWGTWIDSRGVTHHGFFQGLGPAPSYGLLFLTGNGMMEVDPGVAIRSQSGELFTACQVS